MSKFEVSEMILTQLGGSKFEAMTGARHFCTRGHDLQFGLSKTYKGINKVKIELNNDLYDVTFYNFKPRSFELKVVAEVKGILAEQLVKVFEQHTGLSTSL